MTSASSSDSVVDHTLKVVMLGDSAVGKSSLMSCFVEGTFEPDISATIGVDFKVKYINQSGKRIKLTVWDTAGQERFRTLTSSYYRGVHGVVLVYDVSVRETFEHVQAWVEELQRYVSSYADVVKLLVANKIDLPEHAVSRSEGQAVARDHGMMFIETSAKTSVGVQQTFTEVVQKVLESGVLSQQQGPASKSKSAANASSVRLGQGGAEGGGAKHGCCW
eukprot:PhM_4_TR13880/c0_g1_i1/m.56447/K07910/RAB18; Ras-related protein Rab-18